jgi:hypothetical protein
MQSEPDPSPSRLSAESAVGLVFVAIVLVSLFAAGALGVVATRAAGPTPASAPDPEPDAAPAPAQDAVLARDRVAARFKELMLLREIALRERDPRLLQSVWAPGVAGLAADRAEIERLRDADRRLDGLRLPVRVFNAYRPGDGSWVVIARLGRSAAREVTGSGRQVRATRSSAAVYRCTVVGRDGSWRLLRLMRS